MPRPKEKKSIFLLKLAGLFTAYFIAGKIGLSFDAVGGFASLVWPPTGIAIAVMALYGRRYWPAVALGAFAVNISSGAPVGSAVGMAIGNALEAVAASWLLLRDGRFRHTLEDPRSVLSFVGLAAGLSTIISATIGTTSLWLGDVITAQSYATTWTAWWVGDAFGALIVAPFLLVWLGRPASLEKLRGRGTELACMIAAFAGVAALMYGDVEAGVITAQSASHIMMIPLIWAGVSFGMRGATAAITTFSFVSVYATALGIGPFAAAELNEGLVSLHLFVGTSAIMALFLGSAHDERIRSDAERVALMREMGEQAEYTRSIIDLAPIGIKLLDAESNFLQINPAGLRMVEADSLPHLVGRPMLTLTEPDDRPAFAALLKRVFAGGAGGMRHTIKGLGGTRRTLDVKMVPFHDASGKITASLAMFDDKTKEVEQGRQLLEDRTELERLNKTMIGRELKMIEMKKDLQKLRDSDEKDRT